MPTPTPDQGLSLPIDADVADNPVAFTNFVANTESRLVLRYTTMADRTTRHPVGVEGQYSDLSTEGRADAFDGGGWISAAARGYAARRERLIDSGSIVSTTVLAIYAVLVVPLDQPGARYRWGGRLYYTTATTADFKFAFTWPALVTNALWSVIGRDITTPTNITTEVTGTMGGAIPVGGLGIATYVVVDFEGSLTLGATTGNLQLQWAQNTSDPAITTLRSPSNLWLLREL